MLANLIQNSHRPARLAYAIFTVSFLMSMQGFSAVNTAAISSTTATLTQPNFNQNNIKELAYSQGWLRLLYYPENTAPNSKKFTSRVDAPSFFVSQTGKIDPEAELQATLQHLFSQNTNNTAPQEAVQCRFPARTHWLKQQLGIADSQLPSIACPQLEAWLQKIDPSSASLIFAEEYLDNPVSMFGHSFLRLDNAKTNQAYILNYTPKFAPKTSFLKTSYDSLIAGATGEFTVEPYEQKIQQYRDAEGRDVWRYRLKLTSIELQQLARQIWEIKDQHLTYYLTTDNCASEILVLLNTLHPDKNYLKDFHAIVSPAQLVRALQRQNLLEDAVFEPSTKTKTQALINQATKTTTFPKLADTKLSNTVLLPTPRVANDNNPQFAHGLSRLAFGIGQQTYQYDLPKQTKKHSQDFAELGYRLVYHDSLDPRSGYAAGFSLEALSLKLRAYQNRNNQTKTATLFDKDNLALQNFTIIKARSLNPVNTAENGKSWGGQISIEQQSDGATEHLVGNIGGEYGWSVAYGSPTLDSGKIPPNICYALATGNAQAGKGLQQGYRMGIGTTLGCIQQFSDKLRGTAEIAIPFWYQGGRRGDDGYWQPSTNLGIQYDINANNAVRLTHQYQWQPRQPIPINLNTPKENTVKLKATQNFNLQFLHYF